MRRWLRGILRLLHVRLELPEFFTRRYANLRHHTCEMTLRNDCVPFANGDQRPEPSVVLGRRVVVGEEPVLTADGDTLQGSLALSSMLRKLQV